MLTFVMSTNNGHVPIDLNTTLNMNLDGSMLGQSYGMYSYVYIFVLVDFWSARDCGEGMPPRGPIPDRKEVSLFLLALLFWSILAGGCVHHYHNFISV